MVTQTADLLNDPLLIFSPLDHAYEGGGQGEGAEAGVSTSNGTMSQQGVKTTSTTVPNLTSNNNNNPTVSGFPGQNNSNVTVEVNGSRFCIVPSLFRRVENLNWVKSSSNSNSTNGGSGTVLKLDAKCHPDVFEMVLKFFLYNTVPDVSKLSHRKATELIALASPLDGAQVLVQHAQFALSTMSSSGIGGISGVGGSIAGVGGSIAGGISNFVGANSISGGGGTNSRPSLFSKRRLSSFSSLKSNKSTDDINNTKTTDANNVNKPTQPKQVQTQPAVMAAQTDPTTSHVGLASGPHAQLSHAPPPHPHPQPQPQPPPQQPRFEQAQTPLRRNTQQSSAINHLTHLSGSDRSIDNQSIPSRVLLVKRSTSSKVVRSHPNSVPSSTTTGVRAGDAGVTINSADSSNSTIEDESISKLSQPSGANSDDPIENHQRNSSNPFDALTVPPSVTTFTPRKAPSTSIPRPPYNAHGMESRNPSTSLPSYNSRSGKVLVETESHNKPAVSAKKTFGRGGQSKKTKNKKKGSDKTDRVNQKESNKGSNGMTVKDIEEGRPKLPTENRRSTTKLFRSVLGGGSDWNVRKMSHAECCRTSEHIL